MSGIEKSSSSPKLAAKYSDEGVEGSWRSPTRSNKKIVLLIASAWACFQLGAASVFIVDSIVMRAVHLAFALLLAFVLLPPRKKYLRRGIRISDWICGLLAAALALYIIYDYASLVTRYGNPGLLDKWVGLFLLLFLLEATRRAIGPALPIIALVFCLYCFIRPWLPEVFSAKAVSWSRFIGQMTMATEGVYGIPLDVSATIVYLFVLFGALMYRAGGGTFFVELAVYFLGRFRGGPAKAAILGSGLTGMISGSSIANIVTTGTFTIPLMKNVGYPPEKAASIEVASSTDGQIAPPIMGAAAFIIAEYVNVPYLSVVKAAIIPALASYVAIFFIAHFEACKLGLSGLSAAELPPLKKTLKQGFLFFIPLAVLIYELVLLRHSPEKAAFRAIIATLIVILILSWQQTKKIKTTCQHCWHIIIDSFYTAAKSMLSVALATAAAGIIVAVIALGLGGSIVAVVDFLSQGNIFLLLLITALASLFIGMGLPTTATYIVMATIMAPIITEVGGAYGFVIPLIAAHLFCFYFGILADDTPPVGLAAYAAASIAGSDPIRTGLQAFMYDIRTAILPFMFVFNTNILLEGVDSWLLGIGIAFGTGTASVAFVSLTQGWFLTKNRWFDNALLGLIMLFGFLPNYVVLPWGGSDLGLGQYLPMAILGLLLFFLQYTRKKKTARIGD